MTKAYGSSIFKFEENFVSISYYGMLHRFTIHPCEGDMLVLFVFLQILYVSFQNKHNYWLSLTIIVVGTIDFLSIGGACL